MSWVRGQTYVSPFKYFYFCDGLGRQHTEGHPVELNHRHFLFFFSRIMRGLKSVSFTLDCLHLRRVALLLMHKQTAHNFLVWILFIFTRVPSSRVLTNPSFGRQRPLRKLRRLASRPLEHKCAWEWSILEPCMPRANVRGAIFYHANPLLCDTGSTSLFSWRPVLAPFLFLTRPEKEIF